MTYYEWVESIDSLKEKTITDEFINKINTYNFDYPQDVIVRLEDHLIKLMFDKLGSLRDDLENTIDNIKSPQELTLLINRIKDTINQVKKIQKVKSFDTALINELRSGVEKYAETYTKIIKDHYNGITTNEYAIVINNMHLMEGV